MYVANFWTRQSLSPIQSVLAFVAPKHKQNADNCIITRCPIADSVPKVLLYTECDSVLIAVRCLSSHPKSMICRVFKLSNKFYLGVFQLFVRISSKSAASTELVRLRYGAVSVGRHCTFHAASFLHAPHRESIVHLFPQPSRGENRNFGISSEDNGTDIFIKSYAIILGACLWGGQTNWFPYRLDGDLIFRINSDTVTDRVIFIFTLRNCRYCFQNIPNIHESESEPMWIL